MRIQMDVDGSQASGGFTLVPEGEYIAQVAAAVGGRTKKGDRDKVDLRFDLQDFGGKKVGSCFEVLTFIPKGEAGHGIWLHVNKCLGMPWDGTVDFDTDEYVGRSARVKVIINTYQKSDGTVGKNNKISVFYGDGVAVPISAPVDHVAEKNKKNSETLPF